MSEQDQTPSSVELPPSEPSLQDAGLELATPELPPEPIVEPPPETPLVPVRGEDRLEIVDVLRGLAVLRTPSAGAVP